MNLVSLYFSMVQTKKLLMINVLIRLGLILAVDQFDL